MKGLLFVYLACYGGAVASLVNPFVGLLVYASFSILRPESLWPWAVPPGNYSLIVALGMLAGWFLNGLGRWNLGPAWAMMLALGFFGLWVTFTTTFAEVDRLAAWTMAEEILKIVIPIFVGVSTIDSLDKARMLAWILVISEGYLAFEFNLSYLSGYNRVQYEGFADLDNNGVGVVLVACLGLAFFLALNERRRWLQLLGFGASLCMVHATLLTFSRGAMLSMGITGIVAFLLVPKRPSSYIAFALVALLVARLAGPQVIERFEQTFVEKGEDASADTRRAQWTACIQCMKDHPLGIGPDQWRLINDRYGVQKGIAAHSTWMQAGAEFGLPGLGSLLLYYLICIRRLRPLTRESTPVADPWVRHLGRMVITSLAGFMVAGQFVTLFKMEIPYYVALIGAVVLKIDSASRGAGVPVWSDHAFDPNTPQPVGGG